MVKIDLNADLGEGSSADAALMTLVSSVNIACGFHAGDAQTERQVAFDVHRRIERVGLEDHADRAVLGVSPRYVLVADRDTAVADVDQAGDAVQQGRLAAAGGAEQDQKLAVMDIEIEFLDDVRPAVTDAKIGNRYPCHRFF